MNNLSQTLNKSSLNNPYPEEKSINTNPRNELPLNVFARKLMELEVKVAFGISHNDIEAMHKVLAQTLPKVTLAQHECGAIFLGMGYQTVSPETSIPICFFPASQSTSNLITGLACAYSERIPLFIVTGHSFKNSFEKQQKEAYDTIVRIFEPVTADSRIMKSVDQIEEVTNHLYQLAIRTRLPVHMSLPIK